MLKKKLASRFLITAGWLAAITILRWDWGRYLFLFWLGGILGGFLIDSDQLFYLWTFPKKEASLAVRQLFRHRQWQLAVKLLASTSRQRVKLAFHNAPFQVFFTIFGFWVLTSTTSWFGRGMVIVMLLALLQEEIELLLINQDKFLRQRLFWLLQKPLSLKQQKLFVVLMSFFFLGLNLLLI